jgi:hypothetical protein
MVATIPQCHKDEGFQFPMLEPSINAQNYRQNKRMCEISKNLAIFCHCNSQNSCHVGNLYLSSIYSTCWFQTAHFAILSLSLHILHDFVLGDG